MLGFFLPVHNGREDRAHRRVPAGRVYAERCAARAVRGFGLGVFLGLFTVDDETSLTGAFQLDASMLSGARRGL